MSKISRIEKIGTGRGIILTDDMLEHLGVQDQVEVRFEEGRLVLSPPSALRPGPNCKTVEEATDATFEQFDEALRRLATVPDAS